MNVGIFSKTNLCTVDVMNVGIFSKTNFTTFIIFISLLVLTISPASALYEFEGIPLDTRAIGEIEGDLIISGTYGLSSPPLSHTVTLSAAPDFACVYTGVWGGTEKYTGWVEIAVNGGTPKKFILLGEDDCNPDVYASSHGTYWVSHDVTALLTKGDNEITVTTSRGEKGNRLDGRVYGITVVAAVPENHVSSSTGLPQEMRTSMVRAGQGQTRQKKTARHAPLKMPTSKVWNRPGLQ